MDVYGSFLKGKFTDGEVIYMQVPQAFEQYYPKNVVLLLLRAKYGLIQAALAFWREAVAAFTYMIFTYMKYGRSKADPCSHYFKWTVCGLVVWLSWVDDFLVCGKEEAVMEAKKAPQMMNEMFYCDDVREMNKYIMRDLEEPSLKMTQPVLLQSFKEEFDLTQMRALTMWRPTEYHVQRRNPFCLFFRQRQMFSVVVTH
jgi:hypothetical protein